MRRKRNWRITIPARTGSAALGHRPEADRVIEVRCWGEAKARRLALQQHRELHPGALRLPNGTKVEQV